MHYLFSGNHRSAPMHDRPIVFARYTSRAVGRRFGKACVKPQVPAVDPAITNTLGEALLTCAARPEPLQPLRGSSLPLVVSPLSRAQPVLRFAPLSRPQFLRADFSSVPVNRQRLRDV